MHMLPVEAIAEHCNPFEGCWYDIETPITFDEVRACLARAEEALADTPLKLWKSPDPAARERHVQKIAYFVRHGFRKPIEIDVGIPSMGCVVDYPVQDGNHRLASDIYRWKLLGEPRQTPVSVGGSIEHAITLGLWPDGADEVEEDDSDAKQAFAAQHD